MSEANRFCDTQATIYDFIDEYLVVCPQCGGCAWVVPLDIARPNFFEPRRLTCQSCSYSKDWQGTSISVGAARDGYFNLPLWLQTEVGKDILWFHNFRHLQYIEAFVSATLRERLVDYRTGWSHSSVISRLPGWIKAAKNRKHILKAIDRLKQK